MPKSKIEAEFVKLGELDPEDYETRQDFLTAVVVKANKFKDPVYAKLSETAQEWLNAGIKAHKAKKKLPEFPDVGAVPKDEEEDEAPKKTKKKVEEAEDDEEEEAPKKKKKKEEPEEEDEEEEKEPKKKKKKPAEEEDEEEDEPPKKKKKKVEEDEEEEAPKKKKAKDSEPPKASGIKASIKDAIIEDPEISVEGLVKKLGKSGGSKVTISNIRAEFRHSLKHLKASGNLKGIDI